MSIQKITPEMVENSIKDIEFIERANKLTICIITLKNGFIVTGEASAVRPELFDSSIGKEISEKNARNKIWFYLGVCLQESINSINLEILDKIQG